MQNKPKVTIIIPLYVIEDRFFEDLKRFEMINYPNLEVLVVCDKRVIIPKLKLDIKLVHTNKKRTGPAEKRDIAIKVAKGEVCAFIDDDAYPDPNWINVAVPHFLDPQIAGVGGPGLTPNEDNYRQQLTGLVYSSFFCGGHAQYRFVKGKMQFVNDYPAYNLLVRKDVLKKVGGYGSHYYGGEDTFLCLKIVQKGYKILYDPNVIVYHHRRSYLIPYLKQIANIGKHRGYFAKTYPETSSYIWYFLPTGLSVGFVTMLLLSFIDIRILSIFVLTLLIFWLVGVSSVIKSTNIINACLVSIGIILTHLVYGTYFISGVLSKDLDK